MLKASLSLLTIMAPPPVSGIILVSFQYHFGIISCFWAPERWGGAEIGQTVERGLVLVASVWYDVGGRAVRKHASVGLDLVPFKQGVEGSNPSRLIFDEGARLWPCFCSFRPGRSSFGIGRDIGG